MCGFSTKLYQPVNVSDWLECIVFLEREGKAVPSIKVDIKSNVQIRNQYKAQTHYKTLALP